MNDSLNIAVVGACPYPVPQGSQVYLRNTALALRVAGHSAHLVTYGYGVGVDPSGLPLHRASNVPLSGRTAAGPTVAKPAQDALLATKLREVVRTRRIDVVNAHNYEALAVALAARVRPIVYHAHNALTDELPHYFPQRAGAAAAAAAAAAGRAIDVALPRRADFVIAPHEELGAYLLGAGCAADRIRVVPPPIELEPLPPMRHSSTVPPLVYAGNLDRYQNLDALEPIMKHVRAAAPGAKLVIATRATGSRQLLRASELGQVIRTESFREALQELPGDAIFVCPRVSWSGYPIKLLNAMAAGLPIVCFQGAAHPLTHGEDALVAPDGDTAAFADAVLRLMRNPDLRARLGAAARQTAERNHSIEAASAQLDAIFRNLGTRVR